MLTLSIAFGASAEELFEDCEKVVTLPNYKKLQEYLITNKNDNYLCQRLNDNEFLYSDDRNFNYCHLNSDSIFVCESHKNDGTWFPYPNIATRFNGENGKKFVLFKTTRLSHGVYGEGYQVFYFTPKTSNERGYIIFPLKHAGVENGLYSDAGQLCRNMGESEASEPIGIGFEIINEGLPNVTIRFQKKVASCKTTQESIQTINFTWNNGIFIRK